jgi:hypothetical protein
MIRACSELGTLDEKSWWLIDRAIEGQDASFSPVRRKAWRLLHKTKVATPSLVLHEPWFQAIRKLKAGETDYDARQLAMKAIKPCLAVSGRWFSEEDSKLADSPETFDQFMRLDYRAADFKPPDEILNAWLKALEHEVALFRTLSQALTDALEEGVDAGFLDGWDRTSSDVPSVARHPLNAYHSGFYPITRVLADILEKDR